MKKLAIVIIMCCAGFTYAQDHKPKLEKKGDLTIATYFYKNGQVEQIGAFNVKGKLQGEWKSFDIEGNEVAVGNYEAGRKVGKWFFWEGETLMEVDYMDSKIVTVNQWDNKTKVAVNK